MIANEVAPRRRGCPSIAPLTSPPSPGTRGKRYLKRQHLFETGDAAVRFLTELVHRHPHGGWARDIEALHDMLQQVGPEAMHRAVRAALDVGRISTAFVAQCLGRPEVSLNLFPEEVP